MKKHILCLGDSNTHGYCADPDDCADHGSRFNEDERWTCLLQKQLGNDYLITEEGLSGRTTVFVDPINEGMDALTMCTPLLHSHEVIDLLIIMLGTNDTKERFNSNALLIARGMYRLVRKAMDTPCWGDHAPRVLIVAPPPIGDGNKDPGMGARCPEISRGLAAEYAKVAAELGQPFMDAAPCEFNQKDFMHLTARGHRMLADMLAAKIAELGI